MRIVLEDGRRSVRFETLAMGDAFVSAKGTADNSEVTLARCMGLSFLRVEPCSVDKKACNAVHIPSGVLFFFASDEMCIQPKDAFVTLVP